MKILVINNGTGYLPQLKNLLSDHTFKVVKYSEIETVNSEDFDAVILSGGHNFLVSRNGKQLKKEIDLVKNSKKPIFGICFGFEIIAHAFGAKLKLMPNKEHGILNIQIIKPDKIFLNISNFQVFENHRCVVREPTNKMLILACSKDGIEAFKHKTKPIYAVQFHPEIFVKKSCGDEIFYNFLNLIK
ncbi:MAG: gamma-glutamyl-gamma-aminobutyrate hydrolase family protein [bacterium]